MISTDSPQTVPLRESTRPLDLSGEQYPRALPSIEGLHEGVLSEPNCEYGIATQTNPFDQSGTFSINGGSAAFTYNLSRPVFPLPQISLAKERFKAVQKWEGFVIEVKDDTFIARLTPLAGQGSDQEAEIYINEIEEDDRGLIEPGAIFYWSIGYLIKPARRLRASIIRFRRLPKWTERKLEIARAKATELKNLLDEDSSA